MDMVSKEEELELDAAIYRSQWRQRDMDRLVEEDFDRDILDRLEEEGIRDAVRSYNRRLQ